jgi:hypothetical protein
MDKPPTDSIVVSRELEGPKVALTRIQRINTYEVMDSDLDTLDQLVAEENRALGFASLSAGVFFSTLISFIAVPPEKDRAWQTYIIAIAISGVFSAWFFIVWNQARKRRPKLLDRIRKSTTIEQTQTLVP